MTDHADEPLLLTPGPLTTSRTTKEAMLRDWGSRDGEFIAMNARVRDHLVELAGGAGTHTATPARGAAGARPAPRRPRGGGGVAPPARAARRRRGARRGPFSP